MPMRRPGSGHFVPLWILYTERMLSLDDVTVQIGSATLLAGASLDVVPGRLTAVVGPNGAGKTTLLRVASGDLAPTRGRVTLDATPMRDWSPRQQAQRRAVLPQHTRLDFSFSVLDVVLMGRTPHVGRGGESARDWHVADAALDAVGLGALAARDYATLSGGEQQRVHLARALAQLGTVPHDAGDADRSGPTLSTGDADAGRDSEPNRYLLLDEPTASLDLAHQHSVMRVARQGTRDGVGVLAILHDLNLAAQYADRLVLLHDGVVHAQGTPDRVLTPPQIREVFGLSVLVQRHPCHNCPLVVSAPDAHGGGTGSGAASFSLPTPSSSTTRES